MVMYLNPARLAKVVFFHAACIWKSALFSVGSVRSSKFLDSEFRAQGLV